MARLTSIRSAFALTATLALAACGSQADRETAVFQDADSRVSETTGDSIFDLFSNADPDTSVSVNKYIWSASLEVLDFLPIQTIDPFTGVIVTGFGTAPGSARAYRATILINDPALDARSLNVALQTRNGAADAATVRAVEDAILSRARQLRIADGRL